MQKIKVGVIGLGFIGKQHIEALRRLPYVKIIAVSDSNPGIQSWCKKNDIEKIYINYEEMLEKEDLDVVHNCTPNNFHYEVNTKIIEAGCYVYSEKPLTIHSDEAEKLIDLAKKQGVETAVNFNYRNNLMVQEMQQRIKKGRLGSFSHIQVEYLQDWLLYDTDFDWRVQKDKGGESRAVADIGSHCFDTIQFITGEKIVEVYALFHTQYEKRFYTGQTNTFSAGNENSMKENRNEVMVENEDAAIILFKLEGGMKGSINVTQVCAGKKNGLKVLISGTKEAYEWEQETPSRLWIGHKDSGNEVLYAGKDQLSEEIKDLADLPNGHSVGWKDAFVAGFENFYKNLLQEDGIMESPNFSDGLYITKIIEACLKSNRSGFWETV